MLTHWRISRSITQAHVHKSLLVPHFLLNEKRKYLRLAFSTVHNMIPTQISILLFHHTWPNLHPIWRIPWMCPHLCLYPFSLHLVFLPFDCQNVTHPLRVISNANLTLMLSLILLSFQGPWAPCFFPGTQNILGISVKGAFRKHKDIEDGDWPLYALWSQNQHCPFMSWGLGIIGCHVLAVV